MRPVVGLTTYAEAARFGLQDTYAAVLPLSYVQSVHRAGGRAVLITPDAPDVDALDGLDGIVFTGGGDIDPAHYGGVRHEANYGISAERDGFELKLARAALARRDLPVLCICRGMQLVNVALGGKLYQDIATQCPGALVHRDFERYDQLQHDLQFEPRSWLSRLYRGRAGGRVNTVHHQGVKTLGGNLRVEARAVPDRMVEALRYDPGAGDDAPWLYAVQWHPEFQDPTDESLLPTAPLREMFFDAAETRRRRRGAEVGA
jgi:putative glutamine amidotransferase